MPAATPAPYVHVVFFKVKPGAPAGEADALIADAQTLLRTIPSVRELRIGRPAEPCSPDFVRKDYDVALMILFDDFAGLKSYIEHPQHARYVEKHLGHLDIDTLAVYDFLHKTS